MHARQVYQSDRTIAKPPAERLLVPTVVETQRGGSRPCKAVSGLGWAIGHHFRPDAAGRTGQDDHQPSGPVQGVEVHLEPHDECSAHSPERVIRIGVIHPSHQGRELDWSLLPPLARFPRVPRMPGTRRAAPLISLRVETTESPSELLPVTLAPPAPMRWGSASPTAHLRGTGR